MSHPPRGFLADLGHTLREVGAELRHQMWSSPHSAVCVALWATLLAFTVWLGLVLGDLATLALAS